MEYKAFIRVVKSFDVKTEDYDLEHYNIVREPLIIAEDKHEVKQILLEKYPQFFQNDKVYMRETKDLTQFFYVVIFELYNHEKELINQGGWICSECGQMHKNKYESRPRTNERLYGSDKLFCGNECSDKYRVKHFSDLTIFEGEDYYVNKESPNYIYKITEKSTNKCYIGKTRNEPFFRWWNHLSKSSSPFGLYLRKSKLSNWTFEVIDILPSNIKDKQVFEIESKYIIKFNSINNGFNSVLSNKKVIEITDKIIQQKLF